MQGKIICGRYHIIGNLGEGGFGQTYLAEDRHLPGKPQRAIAQFKPTATTLETLQEARRLFEREANILQKLGTHDQIPQLFAHFEEDREFYLVQELIEGYDLRRELTPGKRLSELEVIAILQQALKVLEFVHQQQVIHRNIKPSNLMRQKDGKIILIDFGGVKQISTQVVNQQGKTSLTLQIGTYGYMPSEQALGMPKFVSDIYALGMVGIQAIAGIYPDRLTRDRDTGELVWRYQVQVSPRLADILDKMVRFDFRQRYSSATAVLQALAGFATPLQISPTNPETWLTRGNTLCELKRYEEAISAYEEAILIKSDCHQAWEERGNTLYKLKRYEEALISYTKAIKIKINYPQAWNNQGKALGKLKRYEEAVAAFNKAIELKPNYPQAWSNRGRALFNLQRYEEAIASFDTAIQFNSNHSDAWFFRGVTLHKWQRYEEALAAYDKVIQFKPDYPLAIDYRKKVLSKLGR